MSLAIGRGYCDLNLMSDGQSSANDLVKRAVALGYDTVAINVCVHQSSLTTKSRQNHQAKKAKLDDSAVAKTMLDFPEPPAIDLKESDYPELASRNKKPVVLNRLTVTFSNNDFLPFVTNSTTIKRYDLLAICPESTMALQNLLKSAFRCDIICFDPERVKDVLWSRKLYMECVEKGIHFEVPYSPCIRDSTARRRIIAQAHTYHAVGKSKAIFISSEARNVFELRAPHDVANLGYIFGLNEQQGKAAVKQVPLKATRSAAGRKLGPYRVLVQKKDDLDESERWKIPDEDDSD